MIRTLPTSKTYNRLFKFYVIFYFIFLFAPSWNWIVAANVLLGINQGFAWSMTVTSKLDIVRPEQRGVATGFNEFAGYGGVALAGLITGYLASDFDPRWSLFVFGLSSVRGSVWRPPRGLR